MDESSGSFDSGVWGGPPRVAGVRDAVSSTSVALGSGALVCRCGVRLCRSRSGCLPVGVRLAGLIFPLVFCVGVQSACSARCTAVFMLEAALKKFLVLLFLALGRFGSLRLE